MTLVVVSIALLVDLKVFLSSVSEQRIMYAVCVLCARCAVDCTPEKNIDLDLNPAVF